MSFIELWRDAPYKLCIVLNYNARANVAWFVISSHWDSWPPANFNVKSIIWVVINNNHFYVGWCRCLHEDQFTFIIEKVIEVNVIYSFLIPMSCKKIPLFSKKAMLKGIKCDFLLVVFGSHGFPFVIELMRFFRWLLFFAKWPTLVQSGVEKNAHQVWNRKSCAFSLQVIEINAERQKLKELKVKVNMPS